MKKTFLLTMLAAVLLMPAVVRAQDTVVSATPKDTYFYNNWIDSAAVALHNAGIFDNAVLYGKYFETKDTLTVYGIAASLYTYDSADYSPWLFPTVRDTSWEQVYEHLGLLKPEGDTLRWASDSLYVHLRDTPVSYYFKPDMPSASPDNPVKTRPVYEVYFDNPVQMTDSFYVGITCQDAWANGVDRYPVLITAYGQPSHQFGVAGQTVSKVVRDGAVTYYYLTDSVIGWNHYEEPFMFPIMVPPAVDTSVVDTSVVDTSVVDTTIVDTTIVDTVGLTTVQLLERYVQLMPNPAGERVKVISSFGLRQVEVYDGAGRRVLQRPLTGYAADLDLTALPAGTYHVRITTLTGTVSKKLVVQRR
jgi:hypothetical protein